MFTLHLCESFLYQPSPLQRSVRSREARSVAPSSRDFDTLNLLKLRRGLLAQEMPQLHAEGMTAPGRGGHEGAALGQTPALLFKAAPWRAGKDFWTWSLIPSLPSAVSFSKHSGNSGAHGKVRVCFRLSWLGVLYLESQAACAHPAVRWRVDRALRQREQTCL